MPEEDLAKLREKAETFHFQAEVNRMMTLIINSLYKNKEIFLRELISNASDALDKIRFLSLTNSKSLEGNSDLSIKIQADSKHNLLHIIDSGVGMTKDDLVKNLGTIAKSGTSDFFKKFEESSGDMNLIGQFGVGFYSVFLVADRVTVTSKHNDDKQYIWESTAESDFTVIEDPRGNTLGRGTVITLHLKPEATDYLKEETLRSLVKKYSEFINFPIYIRTTKTETIEVPLDSEEQGKDVTPEDEDDEVPQEQEEGVEEIAEGEEEGEVQEDGTVIRKAPRKTKLIEKTSSEFELINESKPIWLRSPEDVTEKQYNEFYRGFFKATEDPLAYTHFKAEGEVEFRAILYVPGTAPSNLYSAEPINEIKLFVRRVFITDTETEPLLPTYLRFVRGVVDSDDLPLNVSRETLQQSKLLKVIKKKLTKKALDMLKDLSDAEDQEKYDKLYKEYSASIKLGVIEDTTNRGRLTKLLRFHSSESPDKLVSLETYVDRFKKGQDKIFFLAGASVAEIKTSPFLERLTARGFEVLFLHDPIDEYTFQALTDYKGHTFSNAAKEGLKLGDDDEDEQKELEEQFKPLTSFLKTYLSEFIDKAVISARLTTSPSALVAPQFGWSGNMERVMQAQTYAKPDDPMTSFYLKQKKTFEINPRHPVIRELLNKVEKAGDAATSDESITDIARILFDTATLRSGFTLRNPVDFAQKIERVVRMNLGVDVEAKVEVNEERLPLAKDSKEEDVEEHEHDHDEL